MQNIAAIIRSQIPVGVLMSLGAREFTGDPAGVLQFRCGPDRPHRKVRITLTPADTYDVRLFEVEGVDVRELEHADDIYCDQLGELLLAWEGEHLVS